MYENEVKKRAERINIENENYWKNVCKLYANKKSEAFELVRKPLIFFVGAEGFEPPAPCL